MCEDVVCEDVVYCSSQRKKLCVRKVCVVVLFVEKPNSTHIQCSTFIHTHKHIHTYNTHCINAEATQTYT